MGQDHDLQCGVRRPRAQRAFQVRQQVQRNGLLTPMQGIALPSNWRLAGATLP